MKSNCPYCKAESDGNAGDLVRCAGCKKVFQAGGDAAQFLAAASMVKKSGKADEKQSKEIANAHDKKTKKCPCCAEEILLEAIKCKHCGEMLNNQIYDEPREDIEKEKTVSTTWIVALVILFLWGLGKCSSNNNGDIDKPVEKSTSLFSAWDGSNSEMVAATKDRMNDPDSFEHVGTRYSDRGDRVVITMTFRGKNAFHATITSKATGFIDPTTRVLTDFSIHK